MSNIYVSSDWHIGHKNIHRFRDPKHGFPIQFENELEHRRWIMDFAKDLLRKRDTLILLGDICMSEEAFDEVDSLPCKKILVKGNHDIPKSDRYSIFDEIHGMIKYKGTWLTHSPIHPNELWGKVNLHGHVHSNTVDDDRYVNCCVEGLVSSYGAPIVKFNKIKEDRVK